MEKIHKALALRMPGICYCCLDCFCMHMERFKSVQQNQISVIHSGTTYIKTRIPFVILTHIGHNVSGSTTM